MVSGHLRKQSKSHKQGGGLGRREAQRTVKILRILDMYLPILIPELDVDELIRPVSGQAAADGEPKIRLQLGRGDAEVMRSLRDGHSVVLFQPWDEGEQP